MIQHVIIACIAFHSNDTANPTIELNKWQLSARSNWKGYGGKMMVCVLNIDDFFFSDRIEEFLNHVHRKH